MTLTYTELAGGLHYHAHKYESRWFEHWELVNEAWIAVHEMKHIKLARMAIPWRMLDYMRTENKFKNRGRYCSTKHTMKVVSLYTPIYENLMIKDVIARPKKYNDIVDNQDTINWLADNGRLSIHERLMLDMRFHKGMTQKEVGIELHCTESRISQRLTIIMLKLQAAAKRLRR